MYDQKKDSFQQSADFDLETLFKVTTHPLLNSLRYEPDWA